METQPTESQLALQLTPLITATAADSHKAWHIFALLLSLGRPAPLIELASKCTLFRAMPEFIQFLCEIPNSPLHLTRNYSVTISSIGYVAITQFLSKVHLNFMFSPQLGFEFELMNPSRLRGAENVLRTYYRKRKRIGSESDYLPLVKMRTVYENFGVEEENQAVWQTRCGKESASTQAYMLDDNSKRSVNMWLSDPSCVRYLSCKPETIGHEKVKEIDMCMNGKELSCASDLDYDRFLYTSRPLIEQLLDSTCHQAYHRVCKLKEPVVSAEAEINENHPVTRINFSAASCLEADEKVIPDTQAEANIPTYQAILGVEELVEERETEPVIDNDTCMGRLDIITIDSTQSERLPQNNAQEITMRNDSTQPSLDEEIPKKPLKSLPTSAAKVLAENQNQVGKPPSKSKIGPKEALNGKCRAISMMLAKNNVVSPPKDRQHSKRGTNPVSVKQKTRCDENNDFKEKREKPKEKSVPISVNNKPEHKEFPNFESYVVEEEEGSGGYGTVYRARRKSDGLKFAIKCPHANANRHHIQNEVKMLERFGGKNFVIKYEGSFKCGNSDCLVLEHVEHDRPEVLKREIDVLQLQWYGFCMFKALAGLHNLGIVHRDVKPGNFLFSRKANKGYLIDFNLAMDLPQKYGFADRKKSDHDSSSNHVSLPSTKSYPPARNKKLLTSRALDLMNQEAGKVSKSTLLPKTLKRKTDHTKDYMNISSRNIIKSQGADGSGITSTKDATSNRTPSVEKIWTQPMPSQGRKELLSIVQEAFQGTSPEAACTPTSKRKRVAASPGNGGRNFFHLSPMPLHSTGIPIAGAGSLKNKCDGNQKREGPCVGTKGFRAPEVLFRSLHQGPKIDIWSAGVTLLYLIMGRTTFIGDPDHNIKEIAKLKGSEDLWEVAKLHNRESSFPPELFDIKYLPRVRLREWCKLNTRRPDFFEIIPSSLFDLIDKCLTVNPRLRISAEEALRHEFFASCHNTVRKHKLLRQELSLDSGTSVFVDNKQTQTCEKIS